MLTDEQLEILSEPLVPLFQHLEHEIIVDVSNRIKETMTYSHTSEMQAIAMRELGYSPARIRKEAMRLLNQDAEYRKEVAKNTLEHKRKIRKMLNDMQREAMRVAPELIRQAADMAWNDDLTTWKQAGKKLTDNSYLPTLVEAFQKQTAAALQNLTQTTGFKTMSGYEASKDLYRRELDKAVIKICSGTYSREKVIEETVHSLAESGLRTIDFASGYSMQLDTAVRNAVRTGCMQISAKIVDRDILNTGVNLVQVSRHWGARNGGTGHANHEEWQGKVYCIKQGKDYGEEASRIGQDSITDLWYVTGYSIDGTHENDPLGLYGYNCRHRVYAWFEGISEFRDNDPEPEPKTINGKTYDYYAMTQKMRSMERNIRALKREREALRTLNMDTKAIEAKIRNKTSEYKEFCDKCGIRQKTERLRYQSGTSDLKKTKAWDKYRETVKESKLQSMSMSADSAIGDGSEPVLLGEIDINKAGEVINYFREQIRKSEVEQLYIIDKMGKVYYNKGQKDAVSLGTLDLTGCRVLHNHPASNGIISFGADDFCVIRDTDAEEWYLTNEKYNYRVKKIKDMSKLTYNVYYRKALENAGWGEDLHHYIFEQLRKEGYVLYERREVD